MDLKKLIEDYVISLELGDHRKVSGLSSAICVNLIELLDDYLDKQDDEEEISICNKQSTTSIISLICDRIRKFDNIAVAYHDVKEFVHLHDMVCFSRMVGSIPSSRAAKQPEHDLPLDVSHLAYIMRSASHLLRYMNESHSDDWSAEKSLWFDTREHMDKLSSIGFPIYTLDIQSALSSSTEQQSSKPFFERLKSMSTSGALGDSELGSILTSKWFNQFLEITLKQNYPLDRLSSLIALWIVSNFCGCNDLQQVINELVDQIFHEESNSCNIEELLQLGNQVGSYWLSYHRKYCSNFIQANGESKEFEADDDEDDYNYEEDEELSFNSSSGTFRHDAGFDGTGSDNSRARLRRLLKDELLEGPNCLICNSRPKEPLVSLRRQQPCPDCLSEMSIGSEFCALSRQTLPLIRLETVHHLRQKQLLIILSPSEWTRQAMIARSRRIWQPIETTRQVEISERIDIEAKFERLTIIRDDVTNDEHQDEEDEGADEESPSNPDEEAGESNKEQTVGPVRAYMMSSSSDLHQNSMSSESIKMLRFVSGENSQPNSSKLFLCSSDLLVLDQQDDWRKFELRLVASNSLFSNGSLWFCGLRSPVSKLRLGCGRFFGSLELLQHTASAKLNGFTCCHCKYELKKVNSFPGNLLWPAEGNKTIN